MKTFTEDDRVESFKNYSYRAGWLEQTLVHIREQLADATTKERRRRIIEDIDRTLALIEKADAALHGDVSEVPPAIENRARHLQAQIIDGGPT